MSKRSTDNHTCCNKQPQDIESHSILEKAIKAKHSEHRTLGIITKPDAPQKFEASQKNWAKIAPNKHEEYQFRQGLACFDEQR